MEVAGSVPRDTATLPLHLVAWSSVDLTLVLHSRLLRVDWLDVNRIVVIALRGCLKVALAAI